MMRSIAFAVAATVALGLCTARADETQAEIAAPVGTVVLKVHAVGAQIYACKPDGQGGLAWAFREPIATLLSAGKTVGRHFAGPTWKMADGTSVAGKPVAKAPGSTVDDIPWLKLDVTALGGGTLTGVTTVQRIATAGGNKTGPCASEGTLFSVPYAADYVFSRP